MLMFLASVIEQLDLAQEHIAKGDPHNARFGLMLVDNAVELVLHQHAKDKVMTLKMSSWRQQPYEHQRALDKALKRVFRDKVSFAKTSGFLSNADGQTFSIMHGFRNEVYHAGLQHEKILPELARFYLHVACTALAKYEPGFMSWSSSDVLPERAKRYFKVDTFFPGEREGFASACNTLAKANCHDPAIFIETLADRIDAEVEDQDLCISIVADGPYDDSKMTRDRAVIECQIWPLSFSDDGKEFGRANGYAGSIRDFPAWLEANYPLKKKRDPIPAWRSAARKLRTSTEPHQALAAYDSFMKDTEQLREWTSEAAQAVEGEIQHQIDRARGK